MQSDSKKIKAIVSHISRIQGQLESLKTNLQSDEPYDLAALSTSAIKSFDSLRAKIIENFIVTNLMDDKDITAADMEKLQTILKIARA